eukprot:9057106-Pyramimonas_sp.AAC.1
MPITPTLILIPSAPLRSTSRAWAATARTSRAWAATAPGGSPTSGPPPSATPGGRSGARDGGGRGGARSASAGGRGGRTRWGCPPGWWTGGASTRGDCISTTGMFTVGGERNNSPTQ